MSFLLLLAAVHAERYHDKELASPKLQNNVTATKIRKEKIFNPKRSILDTDDCK